MTYTIEQVANMEHNETNLFRLAALRQRNTDGRMTAALVDIFNTGETSVEMPANEARDLVHFAWNLCHANDLGDEVAKRIKAFEAAIPAPPEVVVYADVLEELPSRLPHDWYATEWRPVTPPVTLPQRTGEVRAQQWTRDVEWYNGGALASYRKEKVWVKVN